MERSTMLLKTVNPGKPSISIRAIYTMAMLVITRWYLYIYISSGDLLQFPMERSTMLLKTVNPGKPSISIRAIYTMAM